MEALRGKHKTALLIESKIGMAFERGGEIAVVTSVQHGENIYFLFRVFVFCKFLICFYGNTTVNLTEY